MNTQLAVHNKNLIAPSTLTEAMDFAKMISCSSFCPKGMNGKPGDVLIAMQMGSEVGLSPMQAIQNIAVINGRPCLWGDAALAVVLGSSSYISHREWFEGSIKEGNLTAFCGITRKNSDEYIKSFSMDEAKKASLWGKQGPWSQYPERMLQMRARAFAIRDKFADALRGISVAEEVRDYVVVESKTETHKPQLVHIRTKKQIEAPKQEVINDESNDLKLLFVGIKNDIENCSTLEVLQDLFNKIKKMDFKARPDLFKQIIDIKDSKKLELKSKKTTEEFLAEYDSETGEIKDA